MSETMEGKPQMICYRADSRVRVLWLRDKSSFSPQWVDRSLFVICTEQRETQMWGTNLPRKYFTVLFVLAELMKRKRQEVPFTNKAVTHWLLSTTRHWRHISSELLLIVDDVHRYKELNESKRNRRKVLQVSAVITELSGLKTALLIEVLWLPLSRLRDVCLSSQVTQDNTEPSHRENEGETRQNRIVLTFTQLEWVKLKCLSICFKGTKMGAPWQTEAARVMLQRNLPVERDPRSLRCVFSFKCGHLMHWALTHNMVMYYVIAKTLCSVEKGVRGQMLVKAHVKLWNCKKWTMFNSKLANLKTLW